MTNGNRTRPFHERFDIEVGENEARRRFMNRVSNNIFDWINSVFFNGSDQRFTAEHYRVHRYVANAQGEIYDPERSLYDYAGNDFYYHLQVLEALYQALEDPFDLLHEELADRIDRVIRQSETDLGIVWQPPIFLSTGARLLDETLVNEQLRWLSDPKYSTVRRPFEKGLSHFLESEKKAQLLPDVITDMYEAVEALAKIVTGRPGKDLSANREQFISKIKASDHYKKLLREYIAYANEFRHAEQEGKPRPTISRPEAESFVYLTGLFIRLAVQRS